MLSLKARFNGKSPEVVQYARDFGYGEAMEHYDVKDVVAMVNFLEENAPGEKFTYAKTEVEPFSRVDAFDKLCEGIRKQIEKQAITINNQADEIARLRKELDYYKANRWKQARPAVQALLTEVSK